MKPIIISIDTGDGAKITASMDVKIECPGVRAGYEDLIRRRFLAGIQSAGLKVLGYAMDDADRQQQSASRRPTA